MKIHFRSIPRASRSQKCDFYPFRVSHSTLYSWYKKSWFEGHLKVKVKVNWSKWIGRTGQNGWQNGSNWMAVRVKLDVSAGHLGCQNGSIWKAKRVNLEVKTGHLRYMYNSPYNCIFAWRVSEIFHHYGIRENPKWPGHLKKQYRGLPWCCNP